MEPIEKIELQAPSELIDKEFLRLIGKTPDEMRRGQRGLLVDPMTIFMITVGAVELVDFGMKIYKYLRRVWKKNQQQKNPTSTTVIVIVHLLSGKPINISIDPSQPEIDQRLELEDAAKFLGNVPPPFSKGENGGGE